MRIQVVSDIHLEFRASGDKIGLRSEYINSLRQEDVDVLVLAGDIMNWRDIQEIRSTLEMFSKLATHVVYVPGNHEYYGTSAPAAHHIVTKACEGIENVTPVIRPTSLVLDGQVFLAGTMWYNQKAVERAGYDPEYGLLPVGEHTHVFSDYRWIVGLYPWVFQQADGFDSMLKHLLHSDAIVVTHHLPSPRSTPPQHLGDKSNCFFVNNKTRLLNTRKPKLWIHGHTHTRCDYLAGKDLQTRIVANPCGYPSERSSFFAYQPMLVEV